MNISDIAKKLGQMGGRKTLKKLGKKHFSNAGKIGAEKRWKGHKKSSLIK